MNGGGEAYKGSSFFISAAKMVCDGTTILEPGWLTISADGTIESIGTEQPAGAVGSHAKVLHADLCTPVMSLVLFRPPS
jgi:hypothetical protein